MRNLVLLGGLALSACVTTAPPPASPAGPGSCRADGLAQFTGQPASQQLGADVQRVSGARNLRWVAHGMAVTMEYSPDRVTVWLTADNRVERANCG